MKRIITLFVFLTTTLFYAQNSGITYQAVLYNPSGEILPGNNNSNAVLSNKDICLRFSIKDATTNLEYQETQKVKTDEFGMVNLVVGKGNQVGGYASNFDAIVWNSSNKKLQVEIDVTGNCSSFIEISDQDFSAVPFAYASKTAENVSGIVAIANGGTGASTVVGAKTNLGLNNVDNTSDANKPISTATQAALDTKAPLASPALTGTPTVPTATIGTNTTQIASTAFVNSAIAAATTLDATETVKGKIKLTGDLGGTADAPTVPGLANKENTIAAGTTAQYYRGDKSWQTLDKMAVGLGNVNNTTDADKPVSTATQTALNAKENTIAAGTTAQYFRGDKSWQTLDKTAVGLGNVSNTADADKPVSTATQTALDAKEAAANKSANPALGTSDDLFPTQKAVKTYVDNQISAGVVDASTSTKGKIQLAGDLGGTADAPSVPGLALKAPLNSPQFTGTPSLPTGTIAVTQAANDNSTAVATTAFVRNALSTSNSNARSSDLDMAGNSIANALAIRAGNFQMVDEVLHPFFGGNDPNSVTILNRNNNVTQFVDGRTGSPILAITNSVNEEDEFGTPTPEEGKIGIGTTTPSEKLQVIGNIKSQSFIKENGTAGQFLKADGSVDANTYLTTTSATGTYEPIITAGTTAQYLRGDKTFHTLDKAAVGLGNVSNTTDADKPVSTATQAALDAKEAAANKSANPALGTSDDLFPTQKAVKTYVDNQISAGVVDASTSTKGKIQLAGDLGGTADAPIISNNAVTTTKIANNAVTNAKLGEIVSVNKGGTGADMSNAGAGYIKQATSGANFTTVAKIPVADVDGAVKKVNGVQPDANGNVAVIIGRVFTGATIDPNMATSIVNANPAKQQSDIYIVADGSNPNNGRTFIYDGSDWLEVATDLSATDARYVNVAGDTMEGNLTVPTGTKIIINDAPTGTTDAVNKAYVDNLITSSATPDATDLIKGKIKLTNHLGGTADAPTVPGLALKAPLESPSLIGTPLAPTATAGTNTTQIATTAFVAAATSGKQNTITLTTTGTGAASLTGATLNIPTPNNGTVTEVSDLTIGTSGTDITSTVATATTTPVITLNVPTASATNRGALSAADWTTFNNKVGGSGTENFVPKFSGTSPSKTLVNSSIFDDGTKVGIGTASPTTLLSVQGSANVDNANANTGTIANSLLFGRVTGEGIGSTRSGTTNIHGLNFFTSSAIRMAITNSGFIGLGTTSPYTPLSNTSNNIYGSDGQGVNGFSWSTGGSGYTAAIYNSGNTATHNGLAVKVANNAATTYALDVSRGTAQATAGTPLFNVLGNGNVGIGTNSPTTNLDVVGGFILKNTPAAGYTTGGYAIEFNTNEAAPRIDWLYQGQYVGQVASDANNFLLKNSKPTTGGFSFVTADSPGSGTEKVRITNRGSLGVGTSSPISSLSNAPSGTNFVSSNSAIQSTSGISWLTNTAGYNTSLYNSNNVVGSNGLQVKVANNSNQTYALEVGQNTTQTGISTPLFNVLGNGNVGVGTNAPSAQLHTTGSVRFAGAGTPAVNRVLTSDASGNATWQSAPGSTSVRTITTSTPFSLAVSDNAGFIVVNSAGVVEITVPSTLPAGFYCQIIQQGTGQVRLVGSGVTLNSAFGFLTRAQGSSIGIMMAASSIGFVSGDTGL